MFGTPKLIRVSVSLIEWEGAELVAGKIPVGARRLNKMGMIARPGQRAVLLHGTLGGRAHPSGRVAARGRTQCGCQRLHHRHASISGVSRSGGCFAGDRILRGVREAHRAATWSGQGEEPRSGHGGDHRTEWGVVRATPRVVKETLLVSWGRSPWRGSRWGNCSSLPL